MPARRLRFPIVFSLIEDRQIHLTAVCLLRDYLTQENHRELLAEASNKTKLQVQELLARRFPRPDVASYIRLRLLCAVHNRLLAEQDFGCAHVAERVAARRGRDTRATDAEAVATNIRPEAS